MRQLFFVVMIGLLLTTIIMSLSCTSKSGKRQTSIRSTTPVTVQVMYTNGGIENILNRNLMVINIKDTVVIKSITEKTTHTTTKYVWGVYLKDKIPPNVEVDSTLITFEPAVVMQMKG